LSFGFLFAASTFGGALIEHELMSSARFHRTTSHTSLPARPPLRGSLDIEGPLLLPFEAPQAPRKPPRKSRSFATQVAGVPLLDTSASAG
jgi:hypothetical protein